MREWKIVDEHLARADQVFGGAFGNGECGGDLGDESPALHHPSWGRSRGAARFTL
jgi:hypothetical protein